MHGMIRPGLKASTMVVVKQDIHSWTDADPLMTMAYITRD